MFRFRSRRPRTPRLSVVDDFRLTWKRLRVLATLVSRGDSTVPVLVRRTKLNRPRISIILGALARAGFARRTGLKRRAAPFWTVTPRGREALQLGLKRRLCRRQSLSIREAPDILEIAGHLDDILRDWKWMPHLRWEVFRRVPLGEIMRVVDRIDEGQVYVKNEFAYSYSCLLGGKRAFDPAPKGARPQRWTPKERIRRRIAGIVRTKTHLFADVAGTVMNFLQQPRPLNYALKTAW